MGAKCLARQRWVEVRQRLMEGTRDASSESSDACVHRSCVRIRRVVRCATAPARINLSMTDMPAASSLAGWVGLEKSGMTLDWDDVQQHCFNLHVLSCCCCLWQLTRALSAGAQPDTSEARLASRKNASIRKAQTLLQLDDCAC